MSIREATPGTGAAPNETSKDTLKANLCPRQKRVLSRLLGGVSTVRELSNIAGNNPAETVRQLRNRGFFIGLSWRKGRDQDGKACRYGEYCLDDESLAKAKGLLGVE